MTSSPLWDVEILPGNREGDKPCDGLQEAAIFELGAAQGGRRVISQMHGDSAPGSWRCRTATPVPCPTSMDGRWTPGRDGALRRPLPPKTRRCKHLGLEPAHGVGACRWSVYASVSNDYPHRRIVGQPFSIVGILVARQTTVHRLPEKAHQSVLHVTTAPTLLQTLIRRLRQSQRT